MGALSNFDGVVLRMMAKFGGTATVNIYGAPVYNDGEAVENVRQIEMKVLIFDYPQTNAGEKSQFNTSIMEGDIQCFAQPTNKANELVTQPTIQANRDTVVLNEVTWKIHNMKQVNPSGINNVLYEFHLRK